MWLRACSAIEISLSLSLSLSRVQFSTPPRPNNGPAELFTLHEITSQPAPRGRRRCSRRFLLSPFWRKSSPIGVYINREIDGERERDRDRRGVPSRQSWALAVTLNFSIKKNAILCTFYKVNLTEGSLFWWGWPRSGLFFNSEIGLEVTFFELRCITANPKCPALLQFQACRKKVWRTILASLLKPGLPGACNWKMPNSVLRKKCLILLYKLL